MTSPGVSFELENSSAVLDEAALEPTRIGRNALVMIGFRGAALPLSFATSIVTSRFLLPTGRGAFVLGLLTVTLAATLLGNVGVAVTHEIGHRREAARALVQQGLFVTLVLALLGVAVLFPLDWTLADQAYRRVSLAALVLPAMLVTQTISGALVGLGRLRLWNWLQLALTAGVLGGMLIFVVGLSKGVTGAVFGWSLAQAAVAAVALAGTRSLWWPPRLRGLSFDRFRPILLLGLRIGIVNVVSLVNYRIELVILNLYRGLNSVGTYSLATSLAELVWLATSALGTALTASAVHSEEEEATALIARGVRHAFVVAAVLAAAMAAVGYAAIPTVFGVAFTSARSQLLLLLPGIAIVAPASVLAVYFSIRLGRVRYALGLAAMSAAVTGVVAVLLIPRLGADGAAIASTAGYASSMALAVVLFVHVSGSAVGELIPRGRDLGAYRMLALRLVRR